MTSKEAIARIKNHKIAHKMNEPRAIYISEALDMAIKALETLEKIEAFCRISPSMIYPDEVLDIIDGENDNNYIAERIE